jgi:hypothetical protein
MIRKLEKNDLVWLKPIAEKYGSWRDVKAIAEDPDNFGGGVVAAMVSVPYAFGVMVHDDHGIVLEGLCDTYGIKHLIRWGDVMCQMADSAGIDLHNHKYNEKPWYRGVLTRWGFVESTPEIGHIRYAVKPAERQEEA